MQCDEKEKILSSVEYLVTQQTRSLIPYDEAERIWTNLLTNATREVVAEGLAISLTGLKAKGATGPLVDSKLQALPHDMSNHFLVVSVKGTQSEEEQQEIVDAFRSYRLHGCVFFNREVDIHAIQINKHNPKEFADEIHRQAGRNA